jgi:predicted amidohydrolase YtcJ
MTARSLLGVLLAAIVLGSPLALAQFTAERPQTGSPEAADLVLTNGEIYTADGTWAQALAVRRGVIVAVGDAQALRPYQGTATYVVDLNGKTVLPGFHDMHIHPLGGGQLMRSCVLKREAKPAEIRQTVADCAARAEPGAWITGGMWVNDVFRDEPQDRKLLDEAAPNNPVVLSDETGHSSWANSLALQAAGITRDTKDPLNGAIEHRPDGEPNGLLRESAARMVREKVPPPTARDNAAAMQEALDTILAVGITSLQAALESRDSMMAFASVSDRGRLKQRVKACLGWSYNASGVDPKFEALYAERALYRRDRISPDCVKIANDGVPGEGHTAAMLEPYAEAVPGDTGNTRRFGIMNVPPDVLKKAVTRFDRDGMSMVIHCTGDACARAAVDAIAAARAANGASGVMHQIAHNNFTTNADLKRGRGLGVTFEYSAYLYYLNGVTRTYMKAIGPKRFERYKPVRETIDAGSNAVEGSDWPVSPTPNPWIAIETLVTRRKPGGSEEPPLAPKEAITVKEAIDIYTVNAAKQFGHADSVGSIRAGLLADLIVIDRNPFKVPVTTIHETKVEQVYVDGERVYTGK